MGAGDSKPSTSRQHQPPAFRAKDRQPLEMERPAIFSCVVCGRKTANFWALRLHESRHPLANERPVGFACGVCPARFPLAALRDEHRRECARKGLEVDGGGDSPVEPPVLQRQPLALEQFSFVQKLQQRPPPISSAFLQHAPTFVPFEQPAVGDFRRAPWSLQLGSPATPASSASSEQSEEGESSEQTDGDPVGTFGAQRVAAGLRELLRRPPELLYYDFAGLQHECDLSPIDLWQNDAQGALKLLLVRLSREHVQLMARLSDAFVLVDIDDWDLADVVVGRVRPDARELAADFCRRASETMSFEDLVRLAIRPLQCDSKLLVVPMEDAHSVRDVHGTDGIRVVAI